MLKNQLECVRKEYSHLRRAFPRLAVGFASALVVCLILATPVLAISQTWYLTDATSGARRIMNKGAVGGGGANVTVTNGSNVVWIADGAASGNVGFQAGAWTGQITGTGGALPGTYTLTANIGVWDGAAFTSYGTSGTMTFTRGATVVQTFSISASAFDVPDTQWLALRVNATGSRAVAVNTSATNQSYVNSPSTDPGYPVPDLGPLALFAAGLVIFYVYYKRRLKPQLVRAA